ncbi:MAG TPA: hypothetical protein VKU19_32830 [Bryobacteraceae bacterium]|nr:hypothetical protein [Bryobacteraceae bacterium]
MRFLVIMTLFSAAAAAQPVDPSYGTLTEGQTLSGFRAAAVYVDDGGRAIGARFQHLRSGFTLDLLQIQSVPQSFIWVTTYPTSNMGEPHTQEHLLLGKGNKGRALGSSEFMSLVGSSAFTGQWMTCYDFYSSAGADIFYRHFERTMDALLHPDYSDEEIHREVRNFGVSTNPNGSMRLEEKGSVYNEMVTSMDQPGSRVFREAALALYGPEHPMSFSSGGLPEALRVIQPSDIRRFHAAHYFLANMGAVISIPKEMTLPQALSNLDASLNRLEPKRPNLPVVSEAKLPEPQPAPAGRIHYVAYPHRNDQQPGNVVLLWPAERKLNVRQQNLLSLFLATLGNGPDSILYKQLIDSRTRQADFGAKGVGAFVDRDFRNPIYVIFSDVPTSKMNDQDLSVLRAKVVEEFARVANYADGSPELAEFNLRLKGRIQEQRRSLAKFINSPPGFGLRNTGSGWIDHLYQLNKEPGFRKSLTESEDLAAIEKLLASTQNIWRDYLKDWKVIGTTPNVEAAKPSPELVKQEEKEREERAAAEVDRLKEKYAVTSDTEAIRRYRDEYDAATAVIEKAGKDLAASKFIDHPPMTLDDQLDFQTTTLPGGVKLVSSMFDSMTSTTAGLALRLEAIPEDRLVYVSLLPQLLTGVGVIENGQPVSVDQMAQRLRNEILSLNATFSVNAETGRHELVLRGAGNNAVESRRALEWMNLVLFHPDWRPENLPRIRDLVDQWLGALRNTTQYPEEAWVSDPALAWRRQDDALLLATSSFMTRTHNALRLRWMLKSGGSPAVYRFLSDLGAVKGTRAERKQMLAEIRDGKYAGTDKLSESERALAIEAARDLDATLADLPDSSLAVDWTYLCGLMAHGLEQGPQKTLAALDEVRRAILTTGGARMFLIGSAASQKSLSPELGRLVEALDQGPARKATYRAARYVDRRILGREPEASHPVFVGLVNANSQGGVFLLSAPGASYHDTDREKLLDYLTANLFAGAGAHGMFMKTWAAGLAYSNGLRLRLTEGRLNYYAERTPELPQTLQFVIDELKKARPDPALAEYAIAGAFSGTRSVGSFESRGQDMAADLADGLTPEVVTQFHRAILDLRKDPDLGAELFRRKDRVHAEVLPGMGVKADEVKGGVYLVIGPEKQLSAWEQYLKKADRPDDRLWRLYPRDFWLPAE